MTDGERPGLAANLRRLRRDRGLSSVELARRAAVSRATLTQLEAGAGNPTLDTLYGLANALGAPLAELIAEPPPARAPRVVRAGRGGHVVGDALEAWLLAGLTGRSTATEIYALHLRRDAVHRSAAHPAGTEEHLYLHAGRLRVGPAAAPVELRSGDFVSFDAATEHVYQRQGRTEPRGLLVITHRA